MSRAVPPKSPRARMALRCSMATKPTILVDSPPPIKRMPSNLTQRLIKRHRPIRTAAGPAVEYLRGWFTVRERGFVVVEADSEPARSACRLPYWQHTRGRSGLRESLRRPSRPEFGSPPWQARVPAPRRPRRVRTRTYVAHDGNDMAGGVRPARSRIVPHREVLQASGRPVAVPTKGL